ncbi:MAG TPA: hypothetical protein VH186_38345 [Chloroflexia bacterium]|nr:hypothetical protein [Chloroflexia bacterium]
MNSIRPNTATVSSTSSAPTGPTRTYYLRSHIVGIMLFFAILTAILVPGIVLIACLNEPAFLVNVGTLAFFGLAASGCGAASFLCYWSIGAERLKVGPDGIEYSGSGFSIKTGWVNLVSVGPASTGSSITTGLILDPTISNPTRVRGFLKVYLALQPIFVLLTHSFRSIIDESFNRAIPVGMFQPDWQETEIGSLVRRYAPWVFDPSLQSGEYPAKPARLPELTRQSLWHLPSPDVAMGLLIALNAGIFGYFFVTDLAIAGFPTTLQTNYQFDYAVWQPDGRQLIGAFHEDLYFLDTSNGILKSREAQKVPVAFKENKDSVSSLALSPDGRTFAIGSTYGEIQVWDVASRKKLFNLPGHQDEVNSLTYSPDGKWLASGSGSYRYSSRPLTGTFDASLRLWDLTSQREINKTDFESRISQVAFDNQSHLFTLGGPISGPDISVWDPATAKKLDTLPTDSYFSSFVVSGDGKRLLSQDKNGVLELWDTSSLKRISRNDSIRRKTGNDYKYMNLQLNQDGTRFVVYKSKENMQLFEVTPAGSFEERKILMFDHFFINSLRFTPDSKAFIVSLGQELYVWNL